MKQRFFISLDFVFESHNTQKLDSFRRRFDPKYPMNKGLHMAIVPPFDTHTKSCDDLIHELQDELENFYYGHEKKFELTFSGMDVYKHKGKKILFLNPLIKENLEHCQESLHELCRKRLYSRDKSFKLTRRFLPIGRFSDDLSLTKGIETLRKEMSFPLELSVSAFNLYERKAKDWHPLRPLYHFDQKQVGLSEDTFCYPA